jgi:hypothetical protein
MLFCMHTKEPGCMKQVKMDGVMNVYFFKSRNPESRLLRRLRISSLEVSTAAYPLLFEAAPFLIECLYSIG